MTQLTAKNKGQSVKSNRLFRKDPATDKLIIPGLKDLHTHPFIYSLLETAGITDISKCRTIGQLKDALKEKKGTGLMLGVGLDTNNLSHLTRKELDEISKDDIVILIDPSFHGGLVNTKTAGMLAERTEAKSVKGELNENGTWTEIYLYTCLSITAETLDENTMLEGILDWVKKQYSQGIIEIHDMAVTSAHGLRMLVEARKAWGEDFPVTKIHGVTEALLELSDDKELLYDIEKYFGGIGLKLFADGSFGSHTAALYGAYINTTKDGMIVYSEDDVREIAVLLEQHNLGDVLTDVAIHAIGDRGIDQALKYALILKDLGDKEVWLQHYELSGDEELLAITKHFCSTGIISGVVLNPNFVSDIEEYKARLGEDRIKQINPLRSILEMGIPVRFGTDGMPQDMLRVIYDAVYHPVEEQRLTLEEALKIACGVEKLEDASHTLALKGPVINSLLEGKPYEKGEIEIKKQK